MFQWAHLAPFDVLKNSTFAVTNCCRLILRNLFWSYASDFLLISVAPSHTEFQDEPNILSPKGFMPGHAYFSNDDRVIVRQQKQQIVRR